MVWKCHKFVGQFTPIKWNVSHNLVWMKTIVNYHYCMLIVLVVFFFLTMQRIISYSGLPSVLINVIPSAEIAVLEYGEGKNIYLLSSSHCKLYFIWIQISQCRFTNNFEFIYSKLLKFCICSNVKIMNKRKEGENGEQKESQRWHEI